MRLSLKNVSKRKFNFYIPNVHVPTLVQSYNTIKNYSLYNIYIIIIII